MCVMLRSLAEAHLNTCFKHFIYFVNEFKLIDPVELAPLKDLIDSLMGKDAPGAGDSKEGKGEFSNMSYLP